MHKAAVVALLIFFLGTGAVSQQPRQAAAPSSTRADALRTLDESASQLAELEKIHAKMVQSNEDMSKIYFALSKKIAEVGKVAAQSGRTQDQLVQAVKGLDEMQMSFNLQYLQLQSAMQDENREFTAVSNIMKTKHDTVKNSINNIR